MKRVSSALSFILLAASAALVVLFFFQTRLLDLDTQNATAQRLLQLKHLDTQLNEETLQAVSLQLAHFDSIVRTMSQMRELNALLRDPSNGLSERISPEVDRELATFQDLMDEKFDFIETVKMRTAIVRAPEPSQLSSWIGSPLRRNVR